MADSQLYARLLLTKGAGYPLWIPEPYDDLPDEYKVTGVRIGDVGVIAPDGGFDFVFNICVPRDDPINSGGVPEDFEVIQLAERDVRRVPRHYTPGADVSSANVRKRTLAVEAGSGDNAIIPAGGGAGFSITISSSAAAVLLLPDGGVSADVRRKLLFRNYALKHAENWYRFLNIELERMEPNGAIYLVTGCDKAASWGVACFAQESSETEVSLELKACAVASGRVSYSWHSEVNGCPTASRAGPHPQPGDENQTVFLRGFKVMLREKFAAALKGPVRVFAVEDAKPEDVLARRATSAPYTDSKSRQSQLSSRRDIFVPASTGPADHVELEDIPERLPMYHPSDAINGLLLDEAPDAMVAVTHDTEWMSIISEDQSTIPSGEELYRSLREKFALGLTPDNGVFLDSPDMNSDECGQEVSADISLSQLAENRKRDLREEEYPRTWDMDTTIINHNQLRPLKRIPLGLLSVDNRINWRSLASSELVEGPLSIRSIVGGTANRTWGAEKVIKTVPARNPHDIYQLVTCVSLLGENKTRAVIVKNFKTGPNPREVLESTAALAKNTHPNLLRRKDVSPPTSRTHSIMYQTGNSAARPLATALKEDLAQSIILAFKLVAGLASGLNHLDVQGLNFKTTEIEEFAVIVDLENEFLIASNLSAGPHPREGEAQEFWVILNDLCDKVLEEANRTAYEEEIDRDASTFNSIGQTSPLRLHAPPSPPCSNAASPPISARGARGSSPVVSHEHFQRKPMAIGGHKWIPPRREYVWRTTRRGTKSLAKIANHFISNFDEQKVLSNLKRVSSTDSQSPHRCAGYLREEIILSTTMRDSVIVAHDVPRLLETCIVCKEIVGVNEVFDCICGDPNPGSGSTSRCSLCKRWYHSLCVGSPREFTCASCATPTTDLST